MPTFHLEILFYKASLLHSRKEGGLQGKRRAAGREFIISRRIFQDLVGR